MLFQSLGEFGVDSPFEPDEGTFAGKFPFQFVIGKPEPWGKDPSRLLGRFKFLWVGVKGLDRNRYGQDASIPVGDSSPLGLQNHRPLLLGLGQFFQVCTFQNLELKTPSEGDHQGNGHQPHNRQQPDFKTVDHS